ncbi:MAG: putative metal-dependent hydrolase [Candidatus Azotimanducaceae bacterium]|jgi:predicted metal-dependent hydrolase|tara:strand:+ start:15074 stop:15778 length:705 start_codon:yes stop_codon:yes gene_type:complete
MPEVLSFRHFEVTVIRSARRRSATIKVDQSGVSFRVPNDIDHHKIIELVEKKTSWIRKKLEYAASLAVRPELTFQDGDQIPVLGKPHSLKLLLGSEPHVEQMGDQIQVTLAAQRSFGSLHVRTLLERWLIDEAAILLAQRLDYFAPIVGVRPAGMQVKAYKARWGSCRMDGQIQFNWRLIHGPADIIDYVVVHELCHILEHNHSPAYWSQVERVMPDYKIRRKWLAENGAALTM